ncbi:hypothetical protein AB0D86_18400 [Streptomyces sp. NPDC048324]|uniref:hypothetical protein n=1 Tax=Streptomyces sp. NPDC048324 TaxID=3157205 RepID=UPI0034305D5C
MRPHAARAPEEVVGRLAGELSTVQHADQIVVMREGRAVAAGRHEELLARSALYGGLAASQMLRPGGC